MIAIGVVQEVSWVMIKVFFHLIYWKLLSFLHDYLLRMSNVVKILNWMGVAVDVLAGYS